MGREGTQDVGAVSTSAKRDSRANARQGVLESQRLEREHRERERHRERITDRLGEVPTEWRRRYRNLLQEHNLRPTADIDHVHSVDALRKRAMLLPPSLTYVHMRNETHPSEPEPRVVNAHLRRTMSRSDNKRDCHNQRAMSKALLMFPERPNVARVAPKNLLMMTLEDGHEECVNLQWILVAHKNGQSIARSYQRDAYGDDWAELRLDTERLGQVRLPFWILNKATGLDLKPTTARIQPPSETRYAWETSKINNTLHKKMKCSERNPPPHLISPNQKEEHTNATPCLLPISNRS